MRTAILVRSRSGKNPRADLEWEAGAMGKD